MGRITVFLDTNVLFSAAWSPPGASRSELLFELQKLGKIALFGSSLVKEEAFLNIRRKKPAVLERLELLADQIAWLEDIYPNTHSAAPAFLPSNDRIILHTAVTRKMRYFLTGNSRDFESLYNQTIGGCRVLTTTMFLENGLE